MDDKKLMGILVVCITVSAVFIAPCWAYVKTHAPYCQCGE